MNNIPIFWGKLSVIALIALFRPSFAQIDSSGYVELNNFHAKKTEWSFGVNIGFARMRLEPISGNSRLVEKVCQFENIRIGYTNRFYKKLGMEIGTNLGYFPVYFVAPEEEYYLFRYYDSMAPLPKLMLDAGLRYTLLENKKIAWEIKAALTINKLINERGRLTSGFILDGGNSMKTQVQYVTNPNWNIGTNLGFAILQKLRNKNAIEYSLNYHFDSQNFFQGTYDISSSLSGNSQGNIFAIGKFLNLSVMYIFTGIQKENLKILKKSEDANISSSQLNNYSDSVLSAKLNKASTDIGFFSGLTVSNSKLNDPIKYLKGANAIGTLFSINVQQNSAKGNLFSYQLSIVPYNIGFIVPDLHGNCLLCGKFSDSFLALQGSFGIGKSLFTKRGKQILQIKSGLTASVSTSANGLTGKSELNFEMGGKPYNNKTEDYQIKNFFPLIYFEVCKEFRITDHSILVLGYRYNQGFYKVYRLIGQQVYFGNQSGFEVSQNGSFHHLVAGFKYRIFRKK